MKQPHGVNIGFRRPWRGWIILVVISLCVPLRLSWSQSASVGAVFLEQPAGARAAAMGEAFCGVADDASAIHWNPAGLVLARSMSLHFTHSASVQDQREEYLAFNLPLSSRDAIGLGGYYGFLGVFEKLSDWDKPASTFNAYNLYLTLAWSHAWSEHFFTGITGKAVFQSIDIYSGWAFAGDLGLMAEPFWPNLRFGLTFKNFGQPIRLYAQSDPLPAAIELGASYPLWKDLWLVSVDFHQPLSSDWQIRVGTELNIGNHLFIRAGYRYLSGNEAPGTLVGFSAGLGASIADYRLDYAFTPSGDLGSIHRFSVTLPFNRTEIDQKKMLKQFSAKLKDEQDKITQNYLLKGDRYFKNNDFANALEYYKKIQAINPRFDSIQIKIEQMQKLIQSRNAQKHFGLGNKAYQARDYVTALIEWNKVREITPGFPGLKSKLALVYKKLSPAKITRNAGKRHRKPDPHSDIFNRGLLHLKNGHYAQAKTAWQELLRLDPDNAQIKSYLARTRNLAEMETDDLLQQADDYWAKQQYLEAVELWRNVLQKDPHQTVAAAALANHQSKITELADQYYRLGVQNYAQGSLLKAQVNLNDVLVLEPDNSKALKSLEKIKEKLDEIENLPQ